MSKNLKLVLLFTFVVAVAVTGYFYNENKSAANDLAGMPVVQTNVVTSAVPVATEMPEEVVVSDSAIKTEAVAVKMDTKTEAVATKTVESNPVMATPKATKNKK